MKSNKQYLFICQSKSCLKRGSESVRKEIKASLKAKGLNKEVKVVNTKCMDACKQGPNLVCGTQLFQEVEERNIQEILNLCVETHVSES